MNLPIMRGDGVGSLKIISYADDTVAAGPRDVRRSVRQLVGAGAARQHFGLAVERRDQTVIPLPL